MSLQDRLRLELRAIDARGHGWVEPLNRALAEAYRNRSPDDIAAVALLGAVKLDAAGRTVWFVPWLAAFGECIRARAWLRALTARAEAADHRGRAGDARALAIAVDGVRAGASAPDASSGYGPLEAWRLALVRLRIAQLEGNAARTDRVDRAIEAHRELVRGMNPGFRVQADAFVALGAAYRGREFEPPLAAPASLTLVTLPAQLAAAEAVALGGSVAACMIWSHALAERLPEDLVTSLEWPVWPSCSLAWP